MKQTLYDIFAHDDTRPVGLLLATVMLIWGAVLINPYANTFTISQLYAPLYSSFPSIEVAELVWGSAFLIVSVSTYIGIFAKIKLAHYLMLPGIFLFLFIAITFARVSITAIGPWLHLLFAAALFWKYVRKSRHV